MKAIIEIPKDSIYKYELKEGILTLDRVLSHKYPANYGYIKNTVAEDGDALDIFILSEEPIHPTTEVEIEVFSVIEMTDNGIKDPKIIATIKNYPFHTASCNILVENIVKFLKVYKKGVVVNNISSLSRANEILEQSKKS